jgi:hypothetical protein
VKAFMPPQGLLTVAAYLPKHSEARFVDENVRPARTGELRWAEAGFQNASFYSPKLGQPA